MATNNRRVSDLKKAIIVSPPIPLPPELVNPSLSYWDLLLGRDLLLDRDLLLGQDFLLGHPPPLSQLKIYLFHFMAILRLALNIFDKMVKQTESENSVWFENLKICFTSLLSQPILSLSLWIPSPTFTDVSQLCNSLRCSSTQLRD